MSYDKYTNNHIGFNLINKERKGSFGNLPI